MEGTDYTLRLDKCPPRQLFIESVGRTLQQALLGAQLSESGRITLQYNRRGTGTPGDPVRYVIRVEQSHQLAETVLVVADG
jgi:hypothetical protein